MRNWVTNSVIRDNDIETCGIYDFRFQFDGKIGEAIYIGTSSNQVRACGGGGNREPLFVAVILFVGSFGSCFLAVHINEQPYPDPPLQHHIPVHPVLDNRYGSFLLATQPMPPKFPLS